MKNLLKAFTIFIGASILMTSCRGSLTKRHYRNGYHLNMAGKNHVQPGNGLSAKSNTAAVAAYTAEPVAEEIVFAAAEKKSEPAPGNINTRRSAAENKTNFHPATGDKTTELFPGYIKKGVFEKSTENKKVSASSDDALSLLWLLIVIILIFWLIAFLMGGWIFGEFIHLFLVIALILLILWLLRII